MNPIEEAKKIFDDAGHKETKLAIYSRRECKMVLISTIAEFQHHQEVAVSVKLTDLFPGLDKCSK